MNHNTRFSNVQGNIYPRNERNNRSAHRYRPTSISGQEIPAVSRSKSIKFLRLYDPGRIDRAVSTVIVRHVGTSADWFKKKESKKEEKRKKGRDSSTRNGQRLKEITAKCTGKFIKRSWQGNEGFVNNFPLERLVGALITL